MVGSKVGAKNMKKHWKTVPKVKQKVANWNQKGPTLSQRATKMRNKSGLEKGDRPKMNNEKCLRHLVDLGAHWILKGSPNLAFLYKNYIKSAKRVSRKASWQNMIFGCICNAKMWGLEGQKQAFRIIRVAI